ncbi:DUF4202 family protein [Thermosulfuriphilus sp.]
MFSIRLRISERVIECIQERIRKTVATSQVPEDPLHAENTLKWLLHLCPKADEALKIAALGHDIERAMAAQKVKREDFPSYEAFKEAHAANSAQILKKIMKACGAEEAFIQEVCRLVKRHEKGGDPRSNLLKEADSLSFFEVNLPFYATRNSLEETRRRCLWGLKRLSWPSLKLVSGFRFEDRKVQKILCEELERIKAKIIKL